MHSTADDASKTNSAKIPSPLIPADLRRWNAPMVNGRIVEEGKNQGMGFVEDQNK
jgi:hypothetical protein